MGLSLFTFLDVFVMIATAGMIVFYRQTTPQQIFRIFAPSEKKRSLMGTIQQATVSLGVMAGRFENVIPKSQTEASVTQQRLIRAGYRKESAVKMFYGGKFLLMVALVVLVLITGLASMNYFFVILLALVFGFLGPDFWLGGRIKERQRRIRLGLPDVLDLLVVCVEAGLSLDQATMRTADEFIGAHPAISEELGMVVLEQRAGLPRADAWKHFADRTEVPAVRSLVAMLVQSEQFGTSIGKTLRIHSESLRTQRIQQVEEQAAKTTIKMLFPLVLFIFPSIFLVTLGPAVILMLESFHTNFNH
jgi:tight adherence protein C